MALVLFWGLILGLLLLLLGVFELFLTSCLGDIDLGTYFLIILGLLFLLFVFFVPIMMLSFSAAYEDVMSKSAIDPLELKIEEFGSGLKKETE